LKRKLAFGMMSILLLTSMLTLAFNIYPVSATDLEFPAIYIEPIITVDEKLNPPSHYHTVFVYTNYDGNDIWGYQFWLTYNPLVLEGVEVINGGLISTEDVTFVAGTFNNTIGELGLTLALSEDKSAGYPYPLLNNTGPGVLAIVTLRIVGIGESSITLGVDTKLKRTDGTDIVNAHDMPNHVGHAYFNNVGPDYFALNATYHALLTNYSDLLDDYNSMLEDYNALLTDHNDLQDDYNELLDNYDSLVTYFDSLNSSYYGLQSSYDGLNSTHHDLLDIYSQLQSDYDDLE